jgi:hypothetical protein
MDLQGVELERHVGPAQKGDPLAMAALLRGLAPWVGRICGSIALDDGDDAMQETMIRVLKGIRSPGAWPMSDWVSSPGCPSWQRQRNLRRHRPRRGEPSGSPPRWPTSGCG